MTAALFLLEPGTLAGLAAGAELSLDGAEGRHAATVRRIGVGEQIDVADGSGAVASCDVTSAGRDRLGLRVLALRQVAVPTVQLGLAQALSKGGRDELAVQTATEVGVDTVVPWQAGRSVIRWQGERGARARQKWQLVAREAAKQSRRARIPDVEEPCTTSQLARRAARAALALVLHEDAEGRLLDVPLPTGGEVLVIVGPEGGIAEDEVAQLSDAGAIAVRLGPEVLRASTAGPVALSWLAASIGRWG